LQRDCLLHAYAFIVRVNGKLAELHRLDPPSVTVIINKNTGEPSYRQTIDGQERAYTAADVFHLKAPSTDGYVGRSICAVKPMVPSPRRRGVTVPMVVLHVSILVLWAQHRVRRKRGF
jgi:hypothetical protein